MSQVIVQILIQAEIESRKEKDGKKTGTKAMNALISCAKNVMPIFWTKILVPKFQAQPPDHSVHLLHDIYDGNHDDIDIPEKTPEKINKIVERMKKNVKFTLVVAGAPFSTAQATYLDVRKHHVEKVRIKILRPRPT